MRFDFSAMRARVTHISWPKAGISGHQTARKPSSSADRQRQLVGVVHARSGEKQEEAFQEDRRPHRDDQTSLVTGGGGGQFRALAAAAEDVVVAVYVGTALLLVQSSYRRGWHLSGGCVRRGEMPETAARRELADEIVPADAWRGYRFMKH